MKWLALLGFITAFITFAFIVHYIAKIRHLE